MLVKEFQFCGLKIQQNNSLLYILRLSQRLIMLKLMETNQRLNESLLSETTNQQPAESLLEKYSAKALKSQIGGSSIFQVIFFSWVQPLLSYGAKKTIRVDLMPALPESYSTATEFNKFQDIWSNIEKSKSEGWTIIRSLLKLHSREWAQMFIAVFFVVILFMASPVLTALNIDYLTNHKDNLQQGILLFLLTIVVTLLHRIIFSQYLYRFMNLGIRLSNIVTMIVYNKSLRYSPLADKEFSEAEIINYSQVDAQRLTEVGDQIAAFFYGPLQILFGLFMMYYILGLTFLTTIGVILVILVVSYFLSKITVKLNERVLKAKDQRMKVTEEMLDIIRYIKISAIEKFFFRKVNEKREIEIAVIIKQGINFICVCCLYWFTCPVLIASAYFTYIMLGNQITPEVAFTTMTIVNLFEYPMYSLPNAVSESIQIFTSLKRIEKYLLAKEISSDHIHQVPSSASSSAIQIKNGNFYWKREQKKEEKKETSTDESQKEKQVPVQKDESIDESEEVMESSDCEEEEELKKFKEKDKEGKPLYIHALKDINTTITKGSFTMVLGDIGSGKSSFLQAILNEILSAENSDITISGTLSYSPQKPWIMSKTLKENIVFASQQDPSRLQKVLHYACLEEDLKMFPKGIDTEIGEKGINLSGGQKARISLARSLYSDRDILLLDDILSAVDIHVGEFIVKDTVKGFMKGKTVLMPTHAIKFAPDADEIIIMKKGRIVRKGAYSLICDTPEFKEISHKEETKETTHKEQIEDEKLVAEITMLKDVMEHKAHSHDQSAQAPKSAQIVEELMLPEDHKEGQIDSKVLMQYINLNGGVFRFVAALSIVMLLSIIAKTSASIWIQIWCQNPSEDRYQLYLFIGLDGLAIIFLFAACYIIVFAGARQSTTVHKEVIRKLLYASLNNFYNRVPTGRILNRLTKDLRDLDQAIMYSFLFFLLNVFQLLGALGICIYTTTPFAVIPMVVIGYLANQLRKYYLRSQREVARFQKSTNSPCVTGFLSTISGLSTIRAFNREHQFTEWQYGYFDLNKRVRLTKAGLSNWFSNTLAYLCFLVNMPCIGYCMFVSDSDPSVMGLLMTYALFLIFNVSQLILCQADFQTKLVSVERIYKFMNIESEEGYAAYCENWVPEEEEQGEQVVGTGKIEFKNLRVRYRNDLPDVLKGVDCVIQPGEKIGIVGRTGAGKTTIINTLLGLTEISSGSILIDDHPIRNFSLKALRQSVTMIDQEPTLIKSSFRQNLDLTNRYSDQELNLILAECNLDEIISQKGGLDAIVSNTSLSAGEKQLLCICRAFLKHSKIVLVDQATANIDVKNDSIIQKVIADKFKTSTVLTIAHRLSTLQNSDKIMVMEKGELVEFGTPKELQRKIGGVYSEMMRKHQNEMLK